MRAILRTLMRNPGFAIVVVATLALGIGANATIFTLVDALLLRPPAAVQEPDRVVWIYTSDYSGPRYGASSFPDYEELRNETAVLAGVAAFAPRPTNLVEGGETSRLMTELVSGNYFDVLGVRPSPGRGFDASEAASGAPVAVISQALWRQRFGADAGIIGRAVHLNGGSFTVVGVAPPGYSGGIRGLRTNAWVPIRAEQLLTGSRDFVGERGNRGLMVVGRLAPQATVAEAQARLNALAERMHQAYPDYWTDVHEQGRKLTVVPEREARVPPMVRGAVMGFLALLLGVVGLVLLICCANVANLLLARAAGRSREVAIRISLGAGRARLIRHLLAESLVLALLGGAAGLLLAYWTTGLLSGFQPPVPVPVEIDLSPDVRVLAFTALATLATALIFGLAPALRATKPDIVAGLKEGGPTAGGRGRGRLQSGLVVAQVAISTVLLIGAGLFVRSLNAAQAVDPGFDPGGVVVAQLDLSTQGYTDTETAEFYRDISARLSTLPGVSGVALASRVPLSAGGSRTSTGVAGYQPAQGEDMEFNYSVVSPNYFAVMRIPLLRGRAFTDADRAGAPNVVIVNEAFARRFWPGENPLGKRLTHFSSLEDLEVVGVVPTGKYRSLGEEPTPFIYAPWLQLQNAVSLHVRTSGSPARLMPEVRRVIHERDPDLPIPTLSTMTDLMSFALLPQQIGATLLSLFAGLAMVLAAVGLYGVIAYGVSQRGREIGIRMALGADRGRVLGLVIRQGLVLAGLGLALGLIGGAALGKLASSFLFGVRPFDPLAFAGVVAVLGGAALLASSVPALRASRVDPMTALRYE